MFLGLCGKAGCGKGYISNYIKENYSGVSTFIVPLAQELKRIAKEEFNWNGEKDEIGRTLLQRLGTEIGRECCGENFWIEKWNTYVENLISKNSGKSILIVCDDVRFDNEAKNIHSKGGIVVKIEGRSYDMGENNNHPSEKGVSPELIDITIDNSENSDFTSLLPMILYQLHSNALFGEEYV